jgi:diguanylate cyclase (GGDEF)-like protein
LQQWYKSWNEAYTEVTATFQQDGWRNDLLILHKDVEPLLDKIEQRASSLQLELDVASAKDITHLTDVAKSLSDSVVFIAIGLSIIGGIGYIFFHRVILVPIASIARALKNEAFTQRTDKFDLQLSDAKEIRDLSNAFDEMREQIRTRQSHLDYLAHHDSLTDLPNRSLLRDRLSQAIIRARRDGKMVGLMFLDLDRFKQINDTLGHDVGDQLLRVVAGRITSCVRATDTVARLGGDEFGIVVESISHADQIAVMAGKLLNTFATPIHINSHELHTTTSIGIALGPNDDTEVDSLIKDADLAMYHAKDSGRNNFKFYSGEMAAQVEHHMVLESQLRQAMDKNEFVLHYQPIVSLHSGQIISTEALLRWQHPQRGLLSPAEFLPVLEDSGLIRPLTQWVVTQASHQYLRHNEAGFHQTRMAVNLSGLLLRNDAILEIVLTAIEATRIDPTGLLVEFTEDTLLEALQDSKKALAALHNMGIRIALDDFGTGQSSLSHLRNNPIDIVKIDRDFIHDIPGNKQDCELVDAIIAMAHKLHISVVAEGVETREQLEFLRWHKCDAIQGYYFSVPVDGDTLLEILTKNQDMPLTVSGN